MKIGLVTPGGFDRSGRERVIPVFLWLVERLARRHEVHVYSLYQYPRAEDYCLLGATVHNIGYPAALKPNLRTLSNTLHALRREHQRGRFDLLHGLWANETGLIAALAGRLLHIPSVVTIAGGELVALPEIGYGGQLRAKRRLLVDLTLKLAGTVTCASEFMSRPLRKRRPDARLIVLGADVARFTPPADPPAGPPWRLLHVAGLNRVKDQPTLLRAFKEILANEPEARLDVVGEDTLKGEIQRLAGELGLGGAVAFHGFQPSEVVAEMLQRSHLLLHSSLSECELVVCLEAAACAVPTVGTEVGLIADLAPEAAVAVPVRDAVGMATAAVELLHTPGRRKRLGRHALDFARAHDADRTACQFEALYGEMVYR